ncbi:DUF3006 domain-containing protein [Metabacillus litoralis]|uniref:DUF3006 domain-containing protein n=1 Tax=Metabacillus litoralis TaxID=152268 RepID=A0A5C6V898_9BACI|nr:DUF3006 family protein [Metabacillus litoralis]TXC81572.1 DUF3006 domain-containing protein [Metabacillus litoralis]
MNSGRFSCVYTVDRFEKDIVVLLYREDESIKIELSKNDINISVSEGDILNITFEGSNLINIEFLIQETKEAREEAEELLKKILDN